jgi:hypothetical protein
MQNHTPQLVWIRRGSNARPIALCAAALRAMAIPTVSASAQIDHLAFGNDLAGGLLSITWADLQGGPIGQTSAPIIGIGVTGQARVLAPPLPTGGPGGLAFFTVTGDTFVADWILQNQSNYRIHSAIFNLHGSNSLFDNDFWPSTADSFAGRLGAVYNGILSTAPSHLDATEFDPWADALNTGDMFHQQRILWAIPPAFFPGRRSSGGTIPTSSPPPVRLPCWASPPRPRSAAATVDGCASSLGRCRLQARLRRPGVPRSCDENYCSRRDNTGPQRHWCSVDAVRYGARHDSVRPPWYEAIMLFSRRAMRPLAR